MAAAPSLTLYDHAAELVELIHARMDATDPEDQAQWETLIVRTVTTAKDKVDRCNHALSTLETISAAAGEEIARLKRRQQQANEAAMRLRAYILSVMQAHGLKRMDGHTTGFTLRNNAASVEIPNEDAIPGEYLNWKEVCTPDKKRIKEALAAGQPVEGARLVHTISLVRR
jgi:Siphovirus Gp157